MNGIGMRRRGTREPSNKFQNIKILFINNNYNGQRRTVRIQLNGDRRGEWEERGREREKKKYYNWICDGKRIAFLHKR